MNQTRDQPTENSPAQATTRKSPRLFFIDYLRAALVILVVLHHLAVIYGEGMSFYYVEPPNQESLTYLVLLTFVLANQAWFMGALFLLAGYFTPGSYDRKGEASFLRGRLLRLGVPIIIFYFVLAPISAIGVFLEPSPRVPVPLSWESYWQTYPYLVGLGPTWFIALLLLFSFGYAVWRRIRGNPTQISLTESLVPSYLWLGVFFLGLALLSYLVRIIIPLGKEVLDFPTLAYFPQYLSFFVIGTIASRQDGFRKLPYSMGRMGFVMALVGFIILYPLAFFSGLGGQFLGNGHWQSGVYTLWDSIFAVGLSMGMIVIFRRIFNAESRFGRFLAQHSYTVYIIHSPILVFLAVALQGIDLDNFFKFSMGAVIGVPLCFAVAFLVRRIPFASQVL